MNKMNENEIMNKMNENEIIEFVQEKAIYTGYEGEPYAVTYALETFWGESPRDLVSQIIQYEESIN